MNRYFYMIAAAIIAATSLYSDAYAATGKFTLQTCSGSVSATVTNDANGKPVYNMIGLVQITGCKSSYCWIKQIQVANNPFPVTSTGDPDVDKFYSQGKEKLCNATQELIQKIADDGLNGAALDQSADNAYTACKGYSSKNKTYQARIIDERTATPSSVFKAFGCGP